jgi:hypothetical protein
VRELYHFVSSNDIENTASYETLHEDDDSEDNERVALYYG